jgi:dTDP-4-dehydrorhamnose 3,5-epimerase
MPFTFTDGDLNGVKLITPETFNDSRGKLVETYLKTDYEAAGIETEFIQDKYSESTNGVLRGLHYQTGEYAQAKLVRCTSGVVLDVTVDLREDSPTFGQYSKHVLSEHNNKMVFQPRGFAHGYLVLSDSARFEYKLDNDYRPDKEAGIIWNDPTLDIDWPVTDPILSDKDTELPTFEAIVDRGLTF